MPYIDVDDVTKAFTSEVFALANIEAHQETRIQTIRKKHGGVLTQGSQESNHGSRSTIQGSSSARLEVQTNGQLP